MSPPCGHKPEDTELRTIGVRQLKNEATQVVRAVREEHQQYIITVSGQPVATLRPYSDRDIAGVHRTQVAAEIAAIDRIASEVGSSWRGESLR